ncbi:MAG: VWA domain-containing protein [Halothiobacillus sp.]|jgi:uncharacterized protein YegL|nr:VWA domain-containing protein [Halothiobacillus sp.]
MRRLPIFLVLDISESMAGDNIRMLNKGLDALLRSLRRDPHALETVYLSVIVFAGKARTLTPLVELASFYTPRLPVGSGTSLGAALEHLMNEIDRNVVHSTAERKGDWKPVVYLMTDGKPTDEVDEAIRRWKMHFSHRAALVAIGIGNYAAMDTLQELSEHTFKLTAEDEADFMKFIQWMSQSMSVQSRSVSADAVGTVSLAKVDETVLKMLDDITKAAKVDEDFVILTGKCQTIGLPYVMRYERAAFSETCSPSHHLNGVFPMEADYFELSDDRVMARAINSNALIGAPGCPHCGNPYGFAVCSCGGLMCIKGAGSAKCPWCSEVADFGMMDADSEGSDVTRSRG